VCTLYTPLLLLPALLLTACASGKGVRQLEEREEKYFAELTAQLAANKTALKAILVGGRVNEEQALREVALFESKEAAARVVYATRELLGNNKGDPVQATRSKAILLHLASLAAAQEAEVQAALDTGDAQRATLEQKLQALFEASAGAVATGKTLHSWFERRNVQSAKALADEVRRQIDAFDTAAVGSADQSALIKQLTDRGAKVSSVGAKASDAFGQVIDLWIKNDKGGK
jgi:hypothetical protein